MGTNRASELNDASRSQLIYDPPGGISGSDLQTLINMWHQQAHIHALGHIPNRIIRVLPRFTVVQGNVRKNRNKSRSIINIEPFRCQSSLTWEALLYSGGSMTLFLSFFMKDLPLLLKRALPRGEMLVDPRRGAGEAPTSLTDTFDRIAMYWSARCAKLRQTKTRGEVCASECATSDSSPNVCWTSESSAHMWDRRVA